MSLDKDQLKKAWTDYHVYGNMESRSALVQHYAYLVKITVGRLVSGNVGSLTQDDFLSAGVLALIKSVDHFDPTRNTKFETYAITMIRVAILELIRNEDWVPRSTRDKLKLIERTESLLTTELQRAPTGMELAEAAGVSPEELAQLQAIQYRSHVSSLDDLVPNDADDSTTFTELVEDENANTRGFIEGRELRDVLAQCIDLLNERERKVVELHYYDAMTFSEIAKVLGVSESRAYQLHTQAVGRLRTMFRNQLAVPV
ncbi:MAG: FliA/WhiG family RNA polymerase sigma factor [Fimbriimonadaceae bacterium]|nr:FliA/WhiG family RNA polymerase sigma factor [Fimbriimonadaceae bacterium]